MEGGVYGTEGLSGGGVRDEAERSFRPAFRRFFRHFFQRGSAVLGGLLLLCLTAAFALPLLFAVSAGSPASVLSLAFSAPVAAVAGRTLLLALLSTLLALLVGIPAAFFTATRNFPGRRLLLSLSAVPLCVPPLLVALGYVMFWGMRGVANEFAGLLGLGGGEPVFTFLYSFGGIVLVQGFYNFPLVMKTCSDAWSRIPPEQGDAARLLGAGPFRVFRTVTLIQLLPAVATSAMVVFLYCFFSFVIVLLFGGVGVSVLEVEIYQAARSSLNFSLASSLALVETGIALAVVWLYAVVEGRGRENRGLAWDAPGLERKSVTGWREGALFSLLAVAVLLFFLFPLAQLLLSAFSAGTGSAGTGAAGTRSGGAADFGLSHFRLLFSRPSFFSALYNTVTTSVLSSLLAVSAAATFAVCLKEISRRRGGLPAGLGALPLLPMAVSSVVLGFGATRLAAAWWPGLGGSPWMLVVLQAALYWPFAFRQIFAAMEKIPPAMVDAANLLSPVPLDRVFALYLPLCRKSALTALGFCFALGCGDTTLPLVLAIPRFETLALYTYQLAGAYRFNEACCSGLVLAALAVPLFFVGGLRFFKEEGHG